MTAPAALPASPDRHLLVRAWESCPWGVAVIGADGHVQSANASFLAACELGDEALSGLKESDLWALLASRGSAHSRVDAGDGARAIHYIGPMDDRAALAARVESLDAALREPLASVYGFAELLLTQNYEDAVRRELTATMLEQIEAMTNLLNEFGDLSRAG